MNKTEAAEFLGISVRTLERHVARGELSVSLTRGAHGKERTFDRAELARFKASMDATTYVARPVAPVASDALARRDGLQIAGAGNSAALAALVAALEHARAQIAPAATISDLAHKLTLSLVEAAQLSGLSRGHLRAAIEQKKLKARIIGRGWRVKRADLESYVRKL